MTLGRRVVAGVLGIGLFAGAGCRGNGAPGQGAVAGETGAGAPDSAGTGATGRHG
jgi:hypothetical protein